MGSSRHHQDGHRAAGLTEEQALKTFNMGIGMVLIVDAARVDAVMDELAKSGEEPVVIGKIVGRHWRGSLRRIKAKGAGRENSGPLSVFGLLARSDEAPGRGRSGRSGLSFASGVRGFSENRAAATASLLWGFAMCSPGCVSF